MGINKKKPPHIRSITTFIMLILAFTLIFALFYNKGDEGTYISMSGSGSQDTPTVESLVLEGKVKNVYVINGVGYILVHESDIDVRDFPNYADYNFSYTSYVSLSEIFKTEDGKTMPGIESYIEANKTQSFFAMILPYLPIVIMLVLLFMLFKTLSGKGGGNPFVKSKARAVEKSNVKFDDIAGADEEKAETKELVEFLKNPMKFKEMGARIPKGALLIGPPGTGKTLLAKAVAGESNVPFFSISGSDFVELYVGVGASRVRDLFETAKRNAPCIIFIDEIDAVGRQRGAGLGGGNDEREQTLNQLLVEMDGFESNEGIIVLAATNRADVLDPALLRPGRFDRQIVVNHPDVKGREGIIKIHARNKPIDKDIDLAAIARLTSGFTGADIENFLNEAAILAARDNRVTISMEDITEGINKVLMGPQKKSRIITERDKRITAYHEAGHAIIAKSLDTGDSVHEVSIIPRGMAGGYTSTRPTDDDDHYTLSKLNAKICMLMGGRVAEELVFNDITAGASSDIKRATEVARKMVTEWGMSKKLGFLNFGKGEEVFLGRDYQMHNSYSDATAKLIDEEIKAIIDENYQKTKQMIKDKYHILENMAKLLLEKETIYEEEVDAILSGKDYKDVAEQLTTKLEQKRELNEKKKLEQKLAHEEKMQELKEQTAAAFKKVGVISDEEYEMIKSETKQLKEKNLQILKENKIDASDKENQNEDADNTENVKNSKASNKQEDKPKNKTQDNTDKVESKKENKTQNNADKAESEKESINNQTQEKNQNKADKNDKNTKK